MIGTVGGNLNHATSTRKSEKVLDMGMWMRKSAAATATLVASHVKCIKNFICPCRVPRLVWT